MSGYSKIEIHAEGEFYGLLPDISIDKFEELVDFDGSSDVEYDKYLREKGMHELTDFNPETTIGYMQPEPENIELVVIQKYRGRVLKFKCVYDSDTDSEFDFNEFEKTHNQ